MPKLATKEYCTGCTACTSACHKSCISMIADKEGFYYPTIDIDKCVDCGMCEKVCPIMSYKEIILKKESYNPLAYAAYSKNDEIRLNSSSGGVFSELAKEVIRQEGAVFGASYNKRFEVTHICVEHEKDLVKLRGAKYAQSNLNGVFCEIKKRLDKGQKILFSGTPCQVAGLVSFLKEDYINLVCVDFVCLSVPSPMAWKEYVKYRSKQDCYGEMPISINLRSKETGWSRYSYSNSFEYKDAIRYTTKSSDSLYMKLFGAGYISRESCENCQFKGYARVSDLTIGDFWGIWDIDPDMDDNKGTSVVLVQSEKGAALLKSISDKLTIKKVTLEQASSQNRAMISAIHLHPKRDEALELIRQGHIHECQLWFSNDVVHSRSKTKKLLKRLLRGLARRLKSLFKKV